LARVVLMPPFGGEFFGGRAELEIEAASLFALVRLLDVQAPGFAEAADSRVAFAVDGTVTPDWSARLAPGTEVMVIPRIAGGQSRSDLDGVTPEAVRVELIELRPTLIAGAVAATRCPF
jgi:molybdopterin converting factor small subunit